MRVGGLCGEPLLARLLERGLTGFGAVQRVSANTLTGNVVIHHGDGTSMEQVIEHIGGLLRGEIVPAPDEPEHPHWHLKPANDVAALLGTSGSKGLTTQQARERLASIGENAIPAQERRSQFSILLGQFESWPVGLLAGAAVLSVSSGAVLEAVAILAVVALNGAIGFATESRAEQTIGGLGPAGEPTARALRDGMEAEVRAETLVPGDLMLLQRGMIVPADARLVATNALTVSESVLTGESLPIAKSVAALASAAVPLGDRVNMVYRSTIVTGGSGRAIVVATGRHTEVGRIQRLVGAASPPETPIQRQLTGLGQQLLWITLAASGAIFGIGWLRGMALLQLVRSSMSVAVAAVPEGLPMVATTTLALGIEDMRRHDIFVRRLEAVETLASVNVICFDKTGTLTEGSMSLEVVAVGDRLYRRQDGVLLDRHGEVARAENDPQLNRLFSIVSLCSETEIESGPEGLRFHGSPTENALVQAASEGGIDVADLRRSHARRCVQYRTETYRFMASTHETETGILLAVKGSPSEVLARCSWQDSPDGRRYLTPGRRAEIEAANTQMADQALRVLGIAYREVRRRNVEARNLEVSGEEFEVEGLTWVGLVGLADPVRREAPELMQGLHRAGIQTIMLTGDQSATARAVGSAVGLSSDGATAIIDSADLDRLSPSELASAARRAQAFARISPAQKLQIVRALQESGAVVAMVGDGINDSPALRAADVGIAVGRNGPPAAKEVAEVFIATENLAALLVAIERGRSTYINVRRAIHYILSTNSSEILLMLGATTAGYGELLSPIQLLWINLISDVLPGIGLAMEPPDPDLMHCAPIPGDEPMVRREHWGRLLSEGGMLTAGAMAAGAYGATRHGLTSPQTRTITFGSLVIGQLLHALTYRSSVNRSAAPGELLSPRGLPAIIWGSLAAQGAAMLIPGIRRLIGVAPIGIADMLATLAGGVLPFVFAPRRRADRGAQAGLYFRRGQPHPAPERRSFEAEPDTPNTFDGAPGFELSFLRRPRTSSAVPRSADRRISDPCPATRRPSGLRQPTR